MIYRFFGQECEIVGKAKLTKFAEKIELSPEDAKNVVLGGGAILPADQFEKIFAGEDLLSGRRGSSDNFIGKMHLAIEAYQKQVVELESGKITPVASIAPEKAEK